jgi:hypothetical protein
MAPQEDDIPDVIAEYDRMAHFWLHQIQWTRGMGCMTPVEIWNDVSLGGHAMWIQAEHRTK